MREGRRPRAVARVQEIPDLLPSDPLRLISTWSLAILATIAIGFVLYVGREVLLPVTAAFIVGVMLSPVARRLEALRVPPPLTALLLVVGVTLIVAIRDRVDRPARVRVNQWLAGHRRVVKRKAARI